MPVYQLVPVDLSDADWEASTHKGECRVHAATEKKARQYATREFAIATTHKPGEETKISPWTQKSKVTIQELMDYAPSEYREGRVEVPDGSGSFGSFDSITNLDDLADFDELTPYRVVAEGEPSSNIASADALDGMKEPPNSGGRATESDPCEICGTKAVTDSTRGGDYVQQTCPRCGVFKLVGSAASMLRTRRDAKFIAKLSGWVHDQQGTQVPIITTNVLKEVEAAPPLSLSERSQRLLLEAYNGLESIGDTFNINEPRFISASYSRDGKEVNTLYKILSDQGFMNAVAMGGTTEILPSGYIEAERLINEFSEDNSASPTIDNSKDIQREGYAPTFSSTSDLKYEGANKPIGPTDFFRTLNIPMTKSLVDLLTVAAGYARVKKSEQGVLSSTCVLFAAATGWQDRISTPSLTERAALNAVFASIYGKHKNEFELLAKSLFTTAGISRNSASLGLPITNDGFYDFEAFDFSGLILTESLSRNLEYSLRTAIATFGDDEVSIAHFLIVLFRAPTQKLSSRLEQIGATSSQIAVEIGRSVSSEDPVNHELWKDFGEGVIPFKNERSAKQEFEYEAEIGRAGALSDTIDDVQDKLRFTARAETFAQLISDESLRLPLAVGLFGDWGAGKSFFMRLVKNTIDDITQSARQPNAVASTYLPRIAQIEFNAWHYMDTNLWASLASRIYEGLMEELAGEEKTIPAELRARLREDIRSSKLQAEALEAKRQIAIERQTEAAQKLEAVERVKKDAEIKLGKKLINALKNTNEFRSKILQLSKTAKKFGLSNTLETADDINKLVIELERETVAGRIIWARIKQLFNSRCSALRVVTVLAIAAFIAFNLGDFLGWVFKNHPSVVKWMSERVSEPIAETVAYLVPLTAWAGDQFKHAAKGLSNARNLRNRIEELMAQPSSEDADVAYAKRELVEAETAVDEAEQEIRETEHQLEEVAKELQRINSGGLVYDFLTDKLGNSEYTKNLGLISTIREDFKCLRVLLEDWRTSTAIEELKNEDNNHPIRRIVLYIDDLDRCHPNKVVEVLQAVHLLLAFDLFVVVVAVDSRWLQRSLYREYMPELFADNFDNPISEKMSGVKDFSPHNYLEKIFQIPFSIPKMAPDGFSELMDYLSGEISPPDYASRSNLVVEETIESDIGKEIIAEKAASTPPQPNNQAETSLGDDLPSEQGDLQTNPDPNVHAPVPALREEERRCFSCMHALIKTPRLAKRFVNLYRLIRISGLGGKVNLREFLDTQEKPFVAVTVMLAVNIAYPSASPHLLRTIRNEPTAEQMYPETSGSWKFKEIMSELALYLAHLGDENLDMEIKYIGPLQEGMDPEMLKELHLTMRQAMNSLKVAGLDAELVPIQVYRDWASEIEQFSFNWISE